HTLSPRTLMSSQKTFIRRCLRHFLRRTVRTECRPGISLMLWATLRSEINHRHIISSIFSSLWLGSRLHFHVAFLQLSID
ncbi:hypothetical protein COCCADRAFT_98448, partial [Bipolaris zeicola 26-R-13]